MGKMAIQHIRHYILSQLGTSGVSLVWGANVIARLGDDLEKLPMPRRFSDKRFARDENSNGRRVVRDATLSVRIEGIVGLSIYIWICAGVWGGRRWRY